MSADPNKWQGQSTVDIFGHPVPTWLAGAVLSTVAGVVATLGLAITKVVFGTPGSSRVPFLKLWWWVGILLYSLGCYMEHESLNWNTPESTVIPVQYSMIFASVFYAKSILNEFPTRRSLKLLFWNTIVLVALNLASPFGSPSLEKDFPLAGFFDALRGNEAFIGYFLLTVLVGFTCMQLNGCAHVKSPEVFSVTIPILAALWSSAAHFLVKPATTMFHHHEWRDSTSAFVVYGSTVVCSLMALYHVQSGVQLFSFHYFVPAYVTILCVCEHFQWFFFLQGWATNDIHRTWALFGSVPLLVGIVFNIPAKTPALADIPTEIMDVMTTHVSTATDNGYSALPAGPLKRPPSLQNVLDEHRTGVWQKDYGSDPFQSGKLHTLSLQLPESWGCFRRRLFGIWSVMARFFPVVMNFGSLGFVLYCIFTTQIWGLFYVLTVYMAGFFWTGGLHMCVYSKVGQTKCELYAKTDWNAVHNEDIKALSRPRGPAWSDVRHFIILPNYKEDLAILAEAIESIAQCPFAKEQIGVVLAMEQREQDSDKKADNLEQRFNGRFKYILKTFHPPGLPGETPGKSSNVRWAGERLFEFVDEHSVKSEHCIVTVADADSEFHRSYFTALSYHFLKASREQENKQHFTIWQAPIIHFKNYHTQPAVERLASTITSQHELANLADPDATAFPYSSYSLSLSLCRAVDGWDPDWISEDWHMYLKCFLLTEGRVEIQPVHLPILNYAPEGDNIFETLGARWTQAKRHCLGVSEIVYWLCNIPIVWSRLGGCSSCASFGRCVRFTVRAWPPLAKMIWIHFVSATVAFLGPVNSFIVGLLWLNGDYKHIDSWIFLLNICLQVFYGCSFLIIQVLSVLLYERVKSSIKPAPRNTTLEKMSAARWSPVWLHALTTVTQNAVSAPGFFFCGAFAEWIATCKTAVTHKFDYEVALKPKVDAP